MFVQVAANVLVDPDEGRMRSGAPPGQRLKHERRDIEVAYAAAVGDLRHLHVSHAGRAPDPIGFGLIPQHPREARRLGLKLLSLGLESILFGKCRAEAGREPDAADADAQGKDSGGCCPGPQTKRLLAIATRFYTRRTPQDAWACARVSHWRNRSAASSGVGP